tara:strand:+ start:1371 stop:1643 length:273 start_codon:yes stop_codon:yes gene_type:complete
MNISRNIFLRHKYSIKMAIGIKLVTLSDSEGFDDPMQMLESIGISEVIPAICMNDDCDYTTDMEPDATKGWCECCNTNTVASALVLAGFI